MKKHKFHIPSFEEVNKSDPYGILFGNDNILKYLNLESKDKKGYTLGDARTTIWAILTKDEDVYFGGLNSKIKSLFSGFESEERKYPPNSTIKHKNKIEQKRDKYMYFVFYHLNFIN